MKKVALWIGRSPALRAAPFRLRAVFLDAEL